jgi:hypothetical protein
LGCRSLRASIYENIFEAIEFQLDDYWTIHNYPLPNLPPRGKALNYLFPLGGNEKGGKVLKKSKFMVSLIWIVKMESF